MSNQPQVGFRYNGTDGRQALKADLRIITESWNRVAAVPYIVYMPEVDRVLMLVSCDYPHQAMILSSNDRGRTWSAPEYIEPAAVRTGDTPYAHRLGVSLTYLGKGHLVANVGGLRYFSEDYGRSWGHSQPIPPASNGKPWSQWDPYLVDWDPKTGNVVRIAETGYTCAGDTASGGASQAELRFSDDEGKTWTTPVAVPEWKGLNEVALVRAANGDIVGACRTETPERFKNEIDHYEGLGVSISNDNGASWSRLHLLYEWGRHHPSMVVLPSGEIVMTYVVRKGYPDTAEGFPQFGIEAVVSRDHGQTWDLDRRIVLAEWVGNRTGENSWWASSQATSTVLLPDGKLLTAFGTGYRGQPNAQGLPTPRDVGIITWSVDE